MASFNNAILLYIVLSGCCHTILVKYKVMDIHYCLVINVDNYLITEDQNH